MNNHQVQFVLDAATKEQIWCHLLPNGHDLEEAAFAFTKAEESAGVVSLKCIGWEPVPPSGFRCRSDVYLEVDDQTKAAVIKRAHDLKAGLVEFHSHVGSGPAAFSVSDLIGLREFVPHVFWRLRRRPYVAVVVACSGFAALAWIVGPNTPVPLGRIITEEETFLPSGHSFVRQRLLWP